MTDTVPRWPKRIRLAISTCPNDTFAFHGILENKVDLLGLDFEIQLLDIQQLNDGLFRNQFDVAKASFHAAVLLADRRGARLINAIRDGLGQPGPLTTSLRRRLLDLRGLLFLEHSDDWSNTDFINLLEPDDPAVHEICLLADGLDDALRSAGIFSNPDEQAA